MFTHTVTYENFDGEEVTRDLMFHLSKPELVRIEASFPGGVEAEVIRMQNQNERHRVIALFEKLIQESFGVREGDRFKKGGEVLASLTESPAYEALFMELLEDADKAADFFNKLVPKSKEKK